MLSQTIEPPSGPTALPRDAALLRELVGGPGGLSAAQFDALIVRWEPTQGSVVQFFVARGILDQTGARTLNSVLKGYVKMHGVSLCALFRLPPTDALAPPGPGGPGPRRTASLRPVREDSLRIVPSLRPLQQFHQDVAPMIAAAEILAPALSGEQAHHDAPTPRTDATPAEQPTATTIAATAATATAATATAASATAAACELSTPARSRPPLHVQIAKLRAEMAATRGRHGGSDVHHAALPGDKFVHYTLVRRLGESAHSLVFQARHSASQNIVALKLPRFDAAPKTLPRFAAQARIHARFAHAGVLPLLDAGSSHGAVYLAYADMDTVSIVEYLARLSGRIQAWTLAQLCVDVARVLDAAARVGIVHGDLTPANILMCQQDARIRLTDFGMRIPGEAPSVFTAPELASGGFQTVQTDMYSLGVTLRHAATGRPVPLGLLEYRPDLPPALASVIDRMTAPSPRNRPVSWDEAIAEVLAACPRVAGSSLPNPRA